MQPISPLTLFITPSTPLQDIKHNKEIALTTSPELLAEMPSRQAMKAVQFGQLCAAKEAVGSLSSFAEASAYIDSIIK